MLSWLAYFALIALHATYWLVTTVTSLRDYFRKAPRSLAAKRKQLPQHLALLLVTDPENDAQMTESLLLDSVERAVTWCRITGIPRLTVYDRDGTLSSSSSGLRERLSRDLESPADSVESEIEFPLTPPSSDDSDSRSSSPDSNGLRPRLHVTTLDFTGIDKKQANASRVAVKRRRLTRRNTDARPLKMHIVSRESGKPAISRTTTAILQSQLRRVSPSVFAREQDPVAIQQRLNSLLEGDDGFPSPDLAIVHHISSRRLHKNAMEIHGFPPWQMRLTELYFNGHLHANLARLMPGTFTSRQGSPLEEIEFRRALDEFADAEMRLGT